MEHLQALDNLLRELELEKRKNEIIRRLSLELSRLSTLKDKLDNILQLLEDSFQLKHSMLLLPEYDGKRLQVFASRGFDEQGVGAYVEVGQGVIGIVAQRKRKLHLKHISRQRHYLQTAMGIAPGEDTIPLPGLKNAESQVAIPLLANDELVAVLSAESENVGFFRQEDEDFLMTLSQLLASAIQNAVLLDQLEQKVRERTVALEAKKQELEQLNASKDRLFSIIGHDLRSPAAALQNTTDLIRYYNTKGNVEQLCELGSRISRAAYNINYMLDNLLNWSITQTGDLALQPENLLVGQLFDDVLEVYGEIASSKNIAISKNCPPQLMLLADKNAALIILRNLLSNSVKFTPSGGAIELNAEEQGNKTKITICDNGVGMDQKRLETLFSMKGGKSSQGTAKEKGTGLGMMLVGEFIRLTQAGIEVSSLPEQGTSIQLLFPSCKKEHH